MIVAEDKKTVRCDAGGCTATAALPVALRATLRPGGAPLPDGWLFVVRPDGCRHFCPRCASTYLETLANTPKRGFASS